MTERSLPLRVILLGSLIGLCVSQAPLCNPATVRIGFGTNNFEGEISGQIGGVLTLTCDVTFSGANPPTIGSYTWERNGQIFNTDSNPTLTIASLRSSHGGVYRCRATAQNNQCQTQYSDGRTVSTPPTITSLSSAVDILEGQSFQLTCQADGYPEPSYEWYKTSAIISNRTTYSMQAATVAASGVYVCRARNGRGSTQQTVNVMVSPIPTTIAPQATVEPQTTTMTIEEVTGTTGNITSESDTNPTGSTGAYIGIAIISVVSVTCSLLTLLCFTAWLCYVYKKGKHYEGEEMEMEYQEDAVDEEEAVLETAVPIETVDTNEAVIPQPKKKKTRGKHRKF